jgi:hypothetical protein
MAFDFDLCVLRIHSYGERIKPADVPSRSLQADFFDLPFFASLVPALRSAGLAVHIVSFGLYPVIQAYMDAACGQGSFTRDCINTPGLVGVPDGTAVPGGKVPQLELLAEQLGVERESILFVDGEWEGGGRTARSAQADRD